jgi:hypothetical protein
MDLPERRLEDFPTFPDYKDPRTGWKYKLKHKYDWNTIGYFAILAIIIILEYGIVISIIRCVPPGAQPEKSSWRIFDESKSGND